MTRMDRINQMTGKVELTRSEYNMIISALDIHFDYLIVTDQKDAADACSFLIDKIMIARDRIDERAGL